jgi:hypothetical protein
MLIKNNLPRPERMMKKHMRNDRGAPACGVLFPDQIATDDEEQVTCKRCQSIIERKGTKDA